MAKTAIVVEEGVIQCQHGGKVVLTSSESVHVIGGKKPMHDIDLVGAPIQGCPHRASKGGNCTAVASISSAVTEDNVSASGLKYLLRVDGCKTDKGAALVLVDPGQTNTVVPVKSGGSAGTPAIKELEGTELDTKENIKKERYRVYPLRRSSKQVRALRATRNFDLSKEKYHMYSGNYTHSKVVTKTEAYLYVTFEKVMREFKVINRGDIFNPAILDVQFIEIGEEKKVIRRHIPFYKESGTAEFVYSNMRLKKDDLKNFKPVLFTLGDAKAACVNHHKEISKSIQHDEKALSKKTTTPDKLKESNVKYTSVLLHLDDPIGEVEDLYEEMESNFYRAYAYNKTFTDRVKERNAYAYSVAYFMDELALNKDEKDERKALKTKLTKAYHILVDGVKEDFLPYIVDTCKSRGYTVSVVNKNTHINRGHTRSVTNSKSTLVKLNGFIEHDVALSYLTEVKLCASSLLKSTYNRRTKNAYRKNDFEGRTAIQSKERCRVDAKYGYYLCLGRGVVDYDYKNNKVKKRALTVNYDDHREKSTEIMALTLFSLYFSGRYDDVVNAKGSKYKDAAEDFHYYLKRLQARPEFDDDAQDEINKKFDNSGYTNMLKNAKSKRNDSFIDDYDAIETTAKECAFNWQKSGQIKKFKNLVPKDEKFDFYFEKDQDSPSDLAATLATKLKSPELKTVLGKYLKLEHKSAHRIDLLLNMAHLLTHSRTMFDTEVTNTSPFNAGSAVMQLLKAVSETLQSIDASEHEKIYKTPIFGLYHTSLHGIILHSLIEGLYNTDKFKDRKKIAEDFLSKVAPETEKEFQRDLSNLNDGNIDKDLKVKKAHEKLFAQLKALDGITSQIHGAEDKQKKVDEFSSPTDNKDDIRRAIRKSKPYKVSISAMKGLSFFVTLFTTENALKTYKKNDLKALLEITTGINSITKTVVETGAKVLPRTQKAMVMVDFLLAENSIPQKMIAKLAIPAVVIGAYYEVQALDDEDYDAMLMISTKAALTVALVLVSGIWIAAAGYIALEVLWYLFSSYFIDTKTEVMIEKSLFYQNGRRPYILESLSTTNGRYYIRRGYKEVQMLAKDITKIGGPKEVREFIYKNYADHKKDFQAAAQYEFSSIYKALKNIKIEDYQRPLYIPYPQGKVNISGYLLVNKEYLKEMKVIYLLEENSCERYKTIFPDECIATDDDARKNVSDSNDVIVDIFQSFREHAHLETLPEISKRKYSILINSGETSSKYDLGIRYSTMGPKLVRGQWRQDHDLYLDELIPQPLTSQDLELLK